MEFPEAGKQCIVLDCHRLDFLPVICTYCKMTFCKEHSTPSAHNCEKLQDNFVTETKTSECFKCSYENCKTLDPLKMTCVVCSLHFCLSHRHHGCLDQTPSQARREKERFPKEQFKKAKAETDRMVQDMLKNAKNRALANKIKLMKIKGSSVGDNKIPTTDRVYFSVAPPLKNNQPSKFRNIFISKTWTLGRCISSIAKRFNANEGYDSPDEPKLRLFDCEGHPISGDLSEQMNILLEKGAIVDGDSLILEYCPADNMHNYDYDQLTRKDILAKYLFV